MDFYVKLLGCLLPIPDEAELHFLFQAANCHFPSRVEAAQRTRSSCDLGRKASVNEVYTLKPPICITSIPMKMNWPFCFYLSTSFEAISCKQKTGNFVGQVETNLFRSSRYRCQSILIS